MTGPTDRQVIHFDFISLASDTSAEAIAELVAEASGLKSVAGVQAVGVIRGEAPSDFDLAFFFVLDGFTSLEPFGTDEAYIHFLQGKAARMLRGFAGADVVLRQAFPETAAFAACLALAAPDETYDWEVWAALEDWGAADAVIGLAVGERQRYRGCVLRFSETALAPSRPTDGSFQTSIIAGPCRRL